MNKMVLTAIEAAREAGRAIMEIYAHPFEVYTKEDQSPVTQADLRASNIIKECLKPTGIPFVSEEDLPPDRSKFGRYWLVDPLDGTAEFVKRNGEFTVNIALIENKRPVLGVIYAPTTGDLWATEATGAAWESSLRHCISPCGRYDKVPQGELPAAGNVSQGGIPATNDKRPFTVLVSRSHRTPEVDAYIDKVLRPQHPDLVIDSQGSSLKFARLAEGTADVYVCYSKTKEWDTAAADAILTAVGGKVLKISNGKPLEYDKEDYPNPPFVAWAPKKQ